jgi:dihydroorotase
MLLIKGGRVIDPTSRRDEIGHLVLDGGRIREFLSGDPPSGFDGEVISAAGMWVVPGLIDMHVHLREPGYEWKEDIRTGTGGAAARGGGAPAGGAPPPPPDA